MMVQKYKLFTAKHMQGQILWMAGHSNALLEASHEAGKC